MTRRELPAPRRSRLGRGGIVPVCAVVLAGIGQGCTADLVDAHRRITVEKGVEIDVWVIKSRANPGEQEAGRAGATAVLLHPLLTNKRWFLSVGERLAAEGWDVFLPDLRGHGDSGGRVTWGAKEKRDVKAIVDSLLDEKLIRPSVYVMGASLGGCVGVQYAAIDPRCRGVLALAPPTGIRGYVRCTWPLATGKFIEERVRAEAKAGGYDPADASAVEAARKLKCPLIVVHGRLDTTVPYAQAREVHDAAPEPKKMIRLWADHGGVQMGRDDWLVAQMRALAGMGERRPDAGSANVRFQDAEAPDLPLAGSGTPRSVSPDCRQDRP